MTTDTPVSIRAGLPTLGFAALLLLILFSPAPASAGSNFVPGYRSCGSFNAAYKIVVSASHVPCRKAVQIQKELWLGPEDMQESVNGGSGALGYILLKRFPGWKCTSGSGGGSCKKGRKISAYANYPLPRLERGVEYRRCRDVVIRNPDGGVYTEPDQVPRRPF